MELTAAGTVRPGKGRPGRPGRPGRVPQVPRVPPVPVPVSKSKSTDLELTNPNPNRQIPHGPPGPPVSLKQAGIHTPQNQSMLEAKL